VYSINKARRTAALQMKHACEPNNIKGASPGGYAVEGADSMV